MSEAVDDADHVDGAVSAENNTDNRFPFKMQRCRFGSVLRLGLICNHRRLGQGCSAYSRLGRCGSDLRCLKLNLSGTIHACSGTTGNAIRKTFDGDSGDASATQICTGW